MEFTQKTLREFKDQCIIWIEQHMYEEVRKFLKGNAFLFIVKRWKFILFNSVQIQCNFNLLQVVKDLDCVQSNYSQSIKTLDKKYDYIASDLDSLTQLVYDVIDTRVSNTDTFE